MFGENYPFGRDSGGDSDLQPDGGVRPARTTLQGVLREHADELAVAAETADAPAAADAYAVLAALARGKELPCEAARRVRERAMENDR